MKKTLSILMAALMAVSLGACGSGADAPAGESSATQSAEHAAQDDTDSGEQTPGGEINTDGMKMRVGVVLSTGGLGDKNFNDMTYEGMLKAQEEFGIEFDYIEPVSVSDFVPQLRIFSEVEEYDLIIGIGDDQGEPLAEVSADFPDQKYSAIDVSLDLPNVSAVSTKWPEQTFLCGVIAGLGTQSGMDKANPDENVVGVTLGMDLPSMRLGLAGFMSGVRYVNPDCEVLTATVGAFNDPGKGKEIALSMYNRGADFVQHIAGASGLGVFAAAKEVDRYAFGVGAVQNGEEPDHIVATSMRNVKEMVYNEIKSVYDGTWEGGMHVSGMAEGAVGYSTEDSNVQLPAEILEIVEECRAMIVAGELAPCDDVDAIDEWVAANQYSK